MVAKKIILLALFLICCISVQFVRAQVYTDYLGNGHTDGISVVTSSTELDKAGENTINGFNQIPDIYQTSRFLAHATYGADYEMINSVMQQGIDNWLDEQFALPPSYTRDMLGPISTEFPSDSSDLLNFIGSWWHLAITADDQLRHRVAFALSQILVLSYNRSVANAIEIGSYYDFLMEHAFGNYRDLLMDVTLHPSMGDWLTYYNNPKTDTVANIYPDENYAREIMQLFTIGLYELNLDGTLKLDNNGNPIPTYDNEDIQEMAKIFTGLGPGELWDWVDLSVGWDEPEFGIPYMFCHQGKPMAMYEEMHEPGEKYLLNGFVVPAGQSGMEDIEMAIDHLFNHPNVGPFLAYRLIQRLVKSNPSPAYVERVASAFNDNGEGVRGDLKAVIRAILLDEEALDCSYQQDDKNGRLKEPILRYTQLMRGFNVYNDREWYVRRGFDFNEVLRQNILGSPSVFNFYQPAFSPIGEISDAGLVGPEYQIFNSTTSVAYANWVNDWTLGADPLRIVFFNTGGGAIVSELTLDNEVDLASTPKALVERINVILCHGQMSQRTKRIIIEAISQLDEEKELERVYLALYLTMISPDFVVMR